MTPTYQACHTKNKGIVQKYKHSSAKNKPIFKNARLDFKCHCIAICRSVYVNIYSILMRFSMICVWLCCHALLRVFSSSWFKMLPFLLVVHVSLNHCTGFLWCTNVLYGWTDLTWPDLASPSVKLAVKLKTTLCQDKKNILLQMVCHWTALWCSIEAVQYKCPCARAI